MTETNSQFSTVRLKMERRSGHPWIFQKMVEKPEPKPSNGSVVSVIDRNGTFAGYALFNWHSRIALRMLSAKKDEPVNEEFFRTRIQDAIALREETLRLQDHTNAYRLVHSEGDGLSGLVIDKFNDLIVVEFFSSGMFKFRDVIFRILNEYNRDAKFYWFAEEHVQKQESFDCHAPKAPESRFITENGLKFKVAPEGKHKTGFFNDQRANRLKLSTLVKDKRVLDLCCNSGGFSVYSMAKGGAKEVTAIDLDEEVLKVAEENARMNDAKVRFVHSDIFNWLRVAHENKQQFDVVILDPAKQTRNREEVDKALRRYLDMNRLAMQVVKPGGVLLTCSCTGLVSETEFIESIKRAAFHAGRSAQIFDVTGAGEDHPFMAHAWESRYLKAVWCRIL